MYSTACATSSRAAATWLDVVAAVVVSTVIVAVGIAIGFVF